MPGNAFVKQIKRELRALHRRTRRVVVRALFSYGKPQLVAALHSLGIKPGDSVMLHSAFEPHHGFVGSTEEAIDAVLEAIGPTGNLLMVSLPYQSSTLDYLSKGKTFDVRRTPSAMGLMSEYFRRRPNVIRSLHPTHPILACGPDAEWLIADHDSCLAPCGPGTPFEKLLALRGKAAFFNVPFPYLTFFHYLEDRVAPRLPFPLYEPTPFDVPVIDRSGLRRDVRTLVFSRNAIQRRRFDVFQGWLEQRHIIKCKRIGASRLLLVDLPSIVTVVDAMTTDGLFFYDGK